MSNAPYRVAKKIDLFMLTWQRCEYTAMTLESLMEVGLGVSWSDVTFTVIDQGSTDDNVAIIEGCPLVDRLVKLPKNLGVAGGMEYFRKNCTTGAGYISKIDNDSLFTPGWMKKLVWALEDCPRLGLVGSAQGGGDRPEAVTGSRGAGYTPAKFIGGRFLCRRGVFIQSAIEGKGLFGWQPYQRNVIAPKCEIGWCHPPSVIEHVGDWKMQHPQAITNAKYTAYMKKVGRLKT